MWPFGKSKKTNGSKVNETKFAEAELDATSMGNLIARSQHLTREQFRILVVEFKGLSEDKLIGEFFVSRGVLSPEQLELLLLQQKRMRGEKLGHNEMMKLLRSVEDVQERSLRSEAMFFAAAAKTGSK